MQLFSKELLEMDRNTVKLMIDEMQEELQKQGQTIEEQGQTIEEQVREIMEQEQKLAEKDTEKNTALAQKEKEFEAVRQQMAQRIAELEEKLLEK